MQKLQRAALAALAYLAVGDAGSVRHDTAHLRVPTDEPWKAALTASISNFALPSPVNAAARTSVAGVDAKKGDKGDKEEKSKKKTDQPVQVQVPDNELNQFMGTLSKGCSGRFKQMLLGEGGDLHTFGTAEIKADQSGCKKLHGSFCSTRAHIIHEKKQSSNGRTIESTTDVSGNSCLPSECMSKQDLNQLATFMHTQAKNVIPGDEHEVELHVDCTQDGGTTAAVGVPQRSGSTSVVPTAATLATVMTLIRLSM